MLFLALGNNQATSKSKKKQFRGETGSHTRNNFLNKNQNVRNYIKPIFRLPIALAPEKKTKI